MKPHTLPSALMLTLYFLCVTVGVFTGGIWAFAGIGGGLLLFAFLACERKDFWPEKRIALLALSALLVMAAENSWSVDPATSWREWGKLLTIFVPLLAFSSPAASRILHPRFLPLIAGGAVVSALALALELQLGGPLLQAIKGPHAVLTEYNRGLSYLMILAFPLMAGLMQGAVPIPKNKRIFAVLLFVLVLLVPAGLTESRAAKLALVAGLAVTALAAFLPVLTKRGLAVLSVLCLGWPFAARAFFDKAPDLVQKLPPSWLQRVEIWDYLSYRIAEKPLLGWGLGTTHLLPFEGPKSAEYIFTHAAAPHAHNVVSELWVELGLPGLALGLVFALLTLQKASLLEKKLVPFALGAWAAALCLSLVAYNFWTDSLFSAFALAGFLFAMLNAKREKDA